MVLIKVWRMIKIKCLVMIRRDGALSLLSAFRARCRLGSILAVGHLTAQNRASCDYPTLPFCQ